MERLLEHGLPHVRTWRDKVELYQTKINALTAQSRLVEAIDAAREILEHLGVPLPRAATRADIEAAIEGVDRVLGDRSIESLAALPPSTAAAGHAGALRILDDIHFTTIMSNQSLAPLVGAKMVQLTALHGCTEESIRGYLYHGIHLCELGSTERIEQGYEFGRLARAICTKRQFANVNGHGYYHIFHLRERIRDLIETLREAHRAGWEAGQSTVAAGCLTNTAIAAFIAGVELEDVERQMREIIPVLVALDKGPQTAWLRVYLQCVLGLRGAAADPCSLVGEVYDETKHLGEHREQRHDITVQLVYMLKVMLCHRFGRHAEVVEHYEGHIRGGYPSSGILLPPTVMVYCLARLALCRALGPEHREAALAELEPEREQLRIWASLGPMNYAHKHHLVEAERASVVGQDELARELYDRAIDLAREHEYLNEESLALEHAAEFYLARGRRRLAGYYLGDAYHAYQRWGAHAKLEDLRRRHPELLDGRAPAPRRRAHDPATASSWSAEQPDLDLEAVLRASRAISAEYDQARLLETIMGVCLRQIGARRGVLMLAGRDELVVKAKGVLEEAAEVRLVSEALEDQEDLPHAIIHYVARTSERVLLADAARDGMFHGDPQVRAGGCRSVLCMPILYQGLLVGITYMENNRTPGAFREEHAEVLSLLMTQAAVSIENARLRSGPGDDDFQFVIGGSLAAGTPSYVLRSADQELGQRVESGQFCYVLNARQMGKSSLRVHTMGRLVESGVRCAAIDISAIGSEKLTIEQWYAGIVRSMVSGLRLGRGFDLRSWWRERTFLSPVQRLADFVDEIVLDRISDPIVVFIDEIDSVISLDFALDDFFALIRYFYNKRADDARYANLTFVLLGVATPSDLIQDKVRTPFNIGHAIPLAGFRYDEARGLARGLAGFEEPELVLRAILTWTGGQPFLSQKLCYLAARSESRPPAGKERAWVESLVRARVLDRWRDRDDPEHLRTMEARIMHSPRRRELLSLYRELLERSSVEASETPLESELILSGLVVREWGRLRVGNLVYASVFDAEWVAAGLGSLAGLLGFGLAGLLGEPATPRCPPASAEQQALWPAARQARVAAAFETSGSPLATDTLARVSPMIDAYVGELGHMRAEACLAHRRGEQSDALLDRRMTCLDHRRTELAVLVDVLAEADARVVEQSVRATLGLPRLDECADLVALRTALAPPDDPALAQQIEAQRARLARAAAEERAGRFEPGLAQARAVLEQARTLGYRPLVAEAQLEVGTLHEALAHYDQAERSAVEAYLDAEASGHPTIRLRAAKLLAFVTGVRLARTDEGLLWARKAEAIADAIGADGTTRADLLMTFGNLAARRGEGEPVLDDLRKAVALYEEQLGPLHPRVAAARLSLGAAYGEREALEPAREQFERAVAIVRETYGDHHPSVAAALNNLGATEIRSGRLPEAAGHIRAALELYEATLGLDHPQVAGTLNNLATVEVALGRVDDAIAMLERALAILEASGDTSSNAMVRLQGNLAQALRHAGEPAAAVEHLRAAAALLEAEHGPDHPERVELLMRQGEILLEAGELGGAAQALEQANALRASLPPEAALVSADVAWALARVRHRQGRLPAAEALLLEAIEHYRQLGPALASRRGEALLDLGLVRLGHDSPRTARPPLQEAIGLLATPQVPAHVLARARFALARALVTDDDQDEPQDRAQARQLAQDARAGLADDPALTAEIDAWLAALDR
ncbi:MAG: tetratricopeptide repeat protein [Myxococcales bacterium]|nr:tetratricopeptide repeat protein [Myxococcales bacterium]